MDDTPVRTLSADDLYAACNVEALGFDTTDELEPLTEIIGQDRAVEAVRFGVEMAAPGFNIFVLGPAATDKEELVRDFLEERAATEEPPPDWCYVNDFDDAYRPKYLRLPPGTGRQLESDMEAFTEELVDSLRAAFESEDYQSRRQGIEQETQSRQAEGLEEIQDKAAERDLRMVRTPAGFTFAPVRDGDVLGPAEVEQLDESEQERIRDDIEELQEELQQVVRQVPSQQRDLRQKVRELDREFARAIVHELLAEPFEAYDDLEDVQDFLDAVEEDVVDSARKLVAEQGEQQLPQMEMMQAQEREETLRRYRVNVLVSFDGDAAPVVHEQNPTYHNLVGRIEYRAQMGALTTDFGLIRPGALHRANGGYLMLDVRRLLTQPFAWEALKRALRSREVVIEPLGRSLGLISTRTLEPQPIPLDVKVVLFGERILYYLLHQLDPDFPEFFKVQADFGERMDRTDDGERLYARMLATMIEEDELPPFRRDGIARVIEHGARLVGDTEKLSTRTRGVRDLLGEAAYWAGRNGNGAVTADDVQAAIDARIRRADRIRERTHEAILRDTLKIDTEGDAVGQVNGLSVMRLGEFAFGRPNRITASVRLGDGEIVDIEREVELGGSAHSKGVLILASFLKGRYGTETPFSLSASLVFEQSYAGIDGDSASAAELLALLSAIGEVPLAQNLAVTGSVDQLGDVQPIGGVNEKIEGFFDICAGRGLTGDQGVVVPAANVKHLMVRSDVRQAVDEGRFHVYPVATIDEALAVLTGRDVGERDERGAYPQGTVNAAIESRLERFAQRRREFRAREDGA